MSSIPTWVYLLFFGLLYLGIRRCFTMTIKVKQLILLPAALLWLSLDGLLQALHITYHSLWSFALGILLGSYFGFRQVSKAEIHGDRRQNFIEIPGDWSYLVLIMSVFFIEFFIHYATGAFPNIIHEPVLITILLMILGFFVGMTIGRNGCYYYKFTIAPHTDLGPPTKLFKL